MKHPELFKAVKDLRQDIDVTEIKNFFDAVNSLPAVEKACIEFLAQGAGQKNWPYLCGAKYLNFGNKLLELAQYGAESGKFFCMAWVGQWSDWSHGSQTTFQGKPVLSEFTVMTINIDVNGTEVKPLQAVRVIVNAKNVK